MRNPLSVKFREKLLQGLIGRWLGKHGSKYHTRGGSEENEGHWHDVGHQIFAMALACFEENILIEEIEPSNYGSQNTTNGSPEACPFPIDGRKHEGEQGSESREAPDAKGENTRALKIQGHEIGHGHDAHDEGAGEKDELLVTVFVSTGFGHHDVVGKHRAKANEL